MSQHTSEEILEMARKEIAARKSRTADQRTTREFSWRYAFFGLLGGLLVGLAAWPGVPLDRCTRSFTAFALKSTMSRLAGWICHFAHATLVSTAAS
jgi:hypothetical protein